MEFMTRLRSAIYNEKGIVDLGSIMVGSLISAILAGIMAVAIIGVIKGGAAKSAKQQVAAAVLAEKSYFAENDSYGAFADLNAESLIPNTPTTLCVTVGTANSTYLIAAKATDGRIYQTTNTDPTNISQVTSGTACFSS